MKEGDIYMKGRLFSSSDFWRERMDLYQHDPLEVTITRLVKVLSWLALISLGILIYKLVS